MTNSVQFSYGAHERVHTGRIDGMSKANGSAVYTDDMKLPNMAYAKVLRSPYPHARIKHIDTSRAEALDGVVKVVTGQDLSSYSTYGRFVCDVPVLVKDVARFAGDRVAAVIAESSYIAEEAIALIRVEYEPMEAVLDARDALLPESPVIHERSWIYQNALTSQNDSPNLQSYKNWGNASQEEVEAALSRSARVIEGIFEAPARHQGYLEPHVCLVDANDDHIDVWAPCKAPYALRKQLSRWLGEQPERFHIHPVFIGGDFGGKGSPMEIPLAICLSRLAGRPVKILMSYAEDLMSADPSHGVFMQLRLGVDESHRLTALHVSAVLDGGAYAGFKPNGVIAGIREAGSSYRIPNAFIESRIAYTNTVPRGHMRAPGTPPAVFAFESLMDIAAKELGEDPIEFRRKNFFKAHEENPLGVQFIEARNEEILNAALEELAKLPEPSPPSEGNWAFGTGISVYNRDTHGGQTEVAIEPHTDGSITVWVGFPEQGAGQLTMACRAVQNRLGLSVDNIRVRQAELHQLMFDSGTGGSRVTVTGSEALSNACDKLLTELQSSCDLPETYTNEQLAEAIARLAHKTGGAWMKSHLDFTEMPHVTSFCTQIARVRVDRDTGEVVVEDLITAVDAANILNPLSHQVQIEGGIAHGYSDAMLSDLEIDSGKVTAANLGEYKLPSVRDLPNMVVHVVEGGIGVGKQNIKAIGELTSPGVAPAIANAIADAVGVRVHSLPLKAEKVYALFHQIPGGAQ